MREPARVALLLEIAALRRPNQKRSDLFNPFSIQLPSDMRRVTALFGLAVSVDFFDFPTPSPHNLISIELRLKTTKVPGNWNSVKEDGK
jgi:hypothetical protein